MNERPGQLMPTAPSPWGEAEPEKPKAVPTGNDSGGGNDKRAKTTQEFTGKQTIMKHKHMNGFLVLTLFSSVVFCSLYLWSWIDLIWNFSSPFVSPPERKNKKTLPVTRRARNHRTRKKFGALEREKRRKTKHKDLRMKKRV